MKLPTQIKPIAPTLVREAPVERVRKIIKKTPPSFISLVEGMHNRELVDARAQLAQYEKAVTDYSARVREFTARSAEQKATNEALEASALENAPKLKEEAETLFRRLSKYAGVQSVSATESKIKVLTKLLFVPIRKEAGSKVEKRACIGAFQIDISPGNWNIAIDNKLFTASKDHWAVNRNVPCQGTYQKDIQFAFKKMDYYGVFDILYHFLHSTDDGSAYLRAHEWRDSHRNLPGRVASETFEAGDFVVNIAPQSDGKSLTGYVGKIISISGTSLSIEYKKSMGGHDGSGHGKDRHCWTSQDTEFIKITEEQYNAKEVYDLKDVPGRVDALPILDALPDGTTLEEANEVLKEAYKVKPTLV